MIKRAYIYQAIKSLLLRVKHPFLLKYLYMQPTYSRLYTFFEEFIKIRFKTC